jgi:hypothetical protein
MEFPYYEALTDSTVMCIFDLMTTIVALSAIYLGNTLFGWTCTGGKVFAGFFSSLVWICKAVYKERYP